MSCGLSPACNMLQTVFAKYFASAHRGVLLALSQRRVFRQHGLQLALLTFEVLWFSPNSLSLSARDKPWQAGPRASEGPRFRRSCLQRARIH